MAWLLGTTGLQCLDQRHSNTATRGEQSQRSESRMWSTHLQSPSKKHVHVGKCRWNGALMLFITLKLVSREKKTDPGSVWTWSLSMSSFLLLTDAGSRRHFPAHVGRDTEARTIVKGHRGEFNFTTISNAWLFASKPVSMAERERLMTERRVMKACAAIKAAKLIC